MINLSRKKIIIIVSVVILGIVLSIVLIQKNNQQPTQAPERGGTPVVSLIDKNNIFYNSVTYTDYQAVKARLTDYVISQKGDPWTTVEITDVVTPFRDGSVFSFKATIPSLNQKDLQVEFDYAAQPYATFTIKEKNFNVPLYGGQS